MGVSSIYIIRRRKMPTKKVSRKQRKYPHAVNADGRVNGRAIMTERYEIWFAKYKELILL